VGTTQNSGVEINSVNLIENTYTKCLEKCSDDYELCIEDPPQPENGETPPACSEVKTGCDNECAKDYDINNPDKKYYSFSIEVTHNAAAETRLNISVLQSNKEIWYGETSKMKRGDSEIIETKTFQESTGSCAFVFRARPLDVTGIQDAWKIQDLNFCVSAD
jgi:hypothetical protein